MTPKPRPLPDELRDGFSVREAKDAGVTSRRLRHRDLDTPFRGTRLRAGESADRPEHDEDSSTTAAEARRLRTRILRHARTFATVAAPDWFFSHITAAVIWGLPLPIRMLRSVLPPEDGAASATAPRGIDVAVRGSRRAPRAAGIRGHQLRAALTHVRMHDGLPVASPATVWAQLAPLLTVDELIELGDAIVYIPRRRGMQRGSSSDARGTIAELERAMAAGRREGIAKLREALPQVRVGSASPGETRIRLACVRAGMPEPDLDVDIHATDGTPIGYTEIVFPDYAVAVEYEGDHHRVDPVQWARDIDKHAAYAAAGWEVVRLTAAHAYPGVTPAVERIRDALRRAGWSG